MPGLNYRYRVLIISVLIIACSCNIVYAGSPNVEKTRQMVLCKQFANNKDWNFVENKGQVAEQRTAYYGHQGGVYVYCKRGMISFVFTEVQKDNEGPVSEATGSDVSGVGVQDSEPLHRKLLPIEEQRSSLSALRSSLSTSRTDLILIGSNPSAQIIASGQQEYYENFYFANSGDAGITHVHTYKTITYKNIYPNIDMVLHARESGMKYEFVVHPGGKVSDIQMQWNGMEDIKKLRSRIGTKIEYTLARSQNGPGFGRILSKMSECAPISFQVKNYVKSNFIKHFNRISFHVKNYDKTKLLVIDPTLVWATYYGGTGTDEISGVATDSTGNIYVTGTTSSTGMATHGAFQTLGGGQNAFLTKFNGSGARLWATYYGGNYGAEAQSVAADGLGYIYIYGSTISDSGIATLGAYKATSARTRNNTFLAKFKANGVRQWATYFGGNSNIDPGISDVATDGDGNVFIAGSTTSDSGIATSGAYQTSLGGGGGWGAYLAKFGGGGACVWATYYGGGSNAFGATGTVGIATDRHGNVYMTGSTTSGGGIAANGAYQPHLGGSMDAFLAKFSSGGARLWATYYGGSANDEGNGVATDGAGNVYMTGYTASSSNIASAGAYQTSYGGGEDAFMAKFDSSGARQWATYYGAAGEEVGTAAATDSSGNIYFTGYTYSASDIATAGSYQTSLSGMEDAFLVKFNSSGTRQWGSYFGGAPYSTLGSGVATDRHGNVYLAGQTGSSYGIATPGAFQANNKGGADGFLAKFQSPAYDAGITVIINPNGNTCGNTQSLKVQLHNFGIDALDSVTINGSVNRKLTPVYRWKGKLAPDSTITVILGNLILPSGTDTINSWTSKPNGVTDSVPENDTAKVIAYVTVLPLANIGINKTICQDSGVAVGATAVSGDSYSWTSTPSGFSSTLSRPSVQPAKTTIYYLTETINATGCSKTDSVIITVNPKPTAIAGPNKSICEGDSIVIGDTSSNSYIYNWTSKPSGFSSKLSAPKVSPAVATIYTVIVTNPTTGCSGFNSAKLSVNPLPLANPGKTNYQICTGTHIKIGGYALAGISYSWTSTPGGFISTLSDPVVNPPFNTQYNLTVTDSATGCTNKNTANISVSILKAPIADAGPNQTICSGGPSQVGDTAITGNTYAWASNPSGFASTLSNPDITPLQTTSYLLTVTNQTGCTNFDSVIITVLPRPNPFAGLSENTCSGTIVRLGTAPIANYDYSWTSNPSGFASTLSDPVDSPTITTNYELKETNDVGCADTAGVLITVSPRPDVSFYAKNINGFEYQFAAKRPNYPTWQYQWDFGDSISDEPDTASGYVVSHVYPKNGQYIARLTVSLPGFCTVTDSFLVDVNEQFSLNIFPNPFGLQTDINYTLVKPGHVRISLTDEIGRQLGTLLYKQLSQGEYDTHFDAALWKTRPAMYFVIFQLDDKVIVKKIIQLDSIFY